MNHDRLLYPQANLDNTFHGVGAVINLPPKEINSQRRLRECIEELLVPAAREHAIAVLPREVLDLDAINLTEGMTTVKDGMNSAQMHYHPDSIEFACTGSSVNTVLSDTFVAAQNILEVLEKPETQATLHKTGSDANILVMAALDFLRKSSLEGVSTDLKIDQVRRAYTVLYMLFMSATVQPELYQVLRNVQVRMQADLFAIPWKEFGYAVMHTNVTHARSVIDTNTRTDNSLFVKTRKG